MEALILSCGTGGGHNMAGNAIAGELERRGHSVTLMDPYRLVGKNTADYVGNSYIGLVQRSPRLFGWLYSLGEFYRKLPIHSPVYWANGKMADAMQRYLGEHPCDCIIMTHMYPAHMLDHLKGKMPLPKTVLVATDYTCIPFMEESDCDYYVVPAPDLIGEFCSRGIPREKILPYGIPVRRDFAAHCEKEEARARLGFKRDGRYILLSGGSIGAGQMSETVAVLERFLQETANCHLLIVCGKNRRLYEKLQSEYAGQEQIRVMESTARMADYMKACDLFITKPGGLSSTEAAAAGIPLIHISPIPGCEQRNAEYFLTHGMSLLAKAPKKELLPALYELQQDSRFREMLLAQKCGINPCAAETLCEFLEQAVDPQKKG